MAPPHPLDRPVLAALTGTRQRSLALVDGKARRISPLHGVFAVTDDWSDEALAALGRIVQAHGPSGLVEPDDPPAVPGTKVLSQGLCVQMECEALTAAPAPAFAFGPLGADDAAEMYDLAMLTKPGPYVSRTNELGDFVGVRVEGRLVAMAGERMKPDGFTEVSGVCTHPDFRGRGYAAGLMRHVTGKILARGERAFLHAYAANTGAIGLYETLGFSVRREILFTQIGPEDAA